MPFVHYDSLANLWGLLLIAESVLRFKENPWTVNLQPTDFWRHWLNQILFRGIRIKEAKYKFMTQNKNVEICRILKWCGKKTASGRNSFARHCKGLLHFNAKFCILHEGHSTVIPLFGWGSSVELWLLLSLKSSVLWPSEAGWKKKTSPFMTIKNDAVT